MTHLASSPGEQPRTGAYRVELPRPGDALGAVLRDTYSSARGLPEDMRRLLAKLAGPVASSRNQ